jgi:hypothetical protein
VVQQRGDEVNPLHWTRQHQLAWLVISAIGAVLGLMFGFTYSPLLSMPLTWGAFAMWLSLPESYWQWPVYGFLITGLVFYAVQLFRSSN